jgi:hypothetical protein
MRIHSSLLTSTLVAALALGFTELASPAQAADNSPVAAAKSAKAQRHFSGPLILRRSKVTESSGLVAVGAGFQPIEPVLTSLFCPGPRPCVITAEQNVQVRGTAANNRWAICTQVDGAFMNEPVCPFLGFVPVNSFGANSFEQHESVAPGNHFVRSFLFTDFGADRSIYHMEYSIYVE